MGCVSPTVVVKAKRGRRRYLQLRTEPATGRRKLERLLAGHLVEFRVIRCAGSEAVVRVPHTGTAAAREALNGNLGDGITSETLATSGTLKGLQRRLAGRK